VSGARIDFDEAIGDLNSMLRTITVPEIYVRDDPRLQLPMKTDVG